MNMLILQGSPRSGGNTEILADHPALSAGQVGAAVETLRLADLDIHGCTECFACQKVLDRPGCSMKDDMAAVYKAVRAADLVVMATPVFCWGMTAQMKAAVDRFYAFCKFSAAADGGLKCLIAGKKFALVVTAGGGPYDGAEMCVGSYRAMTAFMRLDNRGELVAAPMAEVGAARKDLLSRTADFAASLVS
jgi:multimeric flavodoxin WrbA